MEGNSSPEPKHSSPSSFEHQQANPHLIDSHHGPIDRWVGHEDAVPCLLHPSWSMSPLSYAPVGLSAEPSQVQVIQVSTPVES